MTKKQWQEITAARDLLGLEDKATRAEIKKAYRRMSKKHHPDLASKNKPGDNSQIEMHQIITAYEVLLDYCESFRFPLTMEDPDSLDGEDWWMDRFGQDPLWGKGSV